MILSPELKMQWQKLSTLFERSSHSSILFYVNFSGEFRRAVPIGISKFFSVRDHKDRHVSYTNKEALTKNLLDKKIILLSRDEARIFVKEKYGKELD